MRYGLTAVLTLAICQIVCASAAAVPPRVRKAPEAQRVFASMARNGNLEIAYNVSVPVQEQRVRQVKLPNGTVQPQTYTVTKIVTETRVQLIARYEVITLDGKVVAPEVFKKAMKKGKHPVLLLTPGAVLSDHDRAFYRKDLFVVRQLPDKIPD